MTYSGLWDFYKSNEWENFRRLILAERTNEQGDLICEYSGKVIVNKYDAICHHKIPLTDTNVFDYNVAFNPENIMVVCHKAHNEIHNRWGVYTRHIYIVHGSPRAGKSTYVLENALKDDLIIDIDRIYSCISTERSNRLLSSVMQIYGQLIDMVKCRNGKWVNAWIMRTFPFESERERLANELKAELIHIDTPKEVCLSRCKTEIERKLVVDYFQKVTPPLST